MPSPLLTLLLTLSFAQAQAPATPTSPPVAKPAVEAAREDPAVTALALKIYAQMRAGKVDPALLSGEMARALTPDVLAQTQPVFDQLGNPTKLSLEAREAKDRGTSYVYLATFATAQFHVRILVDSTGKVAGYALTP